MVCAAGQALKGVRLVGCGSSVPQSFLTNKDLESLVETNDEWIATRTGIRKRHILAEGESLSSHAALASQRALEMAGALVGGGGGGGRGVRLQCWDDSWSSSSRAWRRRIQAQQQGA